MKCVLYISSALVRPGEIDLGRILRVSQYSNAAVGITGILRYADGNFMQALEGEAKAVDLVMGKIRRDRRHHNLIQLADMRIERRQFQRWSMAPRMLDDVSKRDQVDCAGALSKWQARPNAPEVVPEIKTLLNSFLNSMR